MPTLHSFVQSALGRTRAVWWWVEDTAGDIYWFYQNWIDPVLRAFLWLVWFAFTIVFWTVRIIIALPGLFILAYLFIMGVMLALFLLFVVGKYSGAW